MTAIQLSFDFSAATPVLSSPTKDASVAGIMAQKARRGRRAYLSGLAAEAQVERLYLARGDQLLQRRWRGTAGEIDLVLQRGEALVFVEVKRARSMATAAFRVTPRQMRRICHAAEEYLARTGRSLFTEMRFEVALLDEIGRIEIVEDAFCGYLMSCEGSAAMDAGW